MRNKIIAILGVCALAPLCLAGTTSLPVSFSYRDAPPVLDLAKVERFAVHVQDLPPAPSPGTVYSAAYVWRLAGEKDDRGSAGVMTKFKTFEDVIRGVPIEVSGYGGMTLVRKVPVTGFYAGIRKSLGKDISIYAAVGASIAQGGTWAPSLGAQFSVRF